MCSGTEAASYGCSEGAIDAENAIGDLREPMGDERLHAYLIELAESPNAKEKALPYFSEPTSE